MRLLLKGFLIACLVVGCSHFTVGEVNKTIVPTAEIHIESWQKTFGGPKDSEANSVQQTTDGGYIITGYTRSYSAGGCDAWLIKTDANGNKLWDRTFGGSNDDVANSVQQTTDGGYIITGYTHLYDTDGYDAWLIKTDSSGDKEWDGTYVDGVGKSVQQTNDGGFVVAGCKYIKDDDLWLIKTDSFGVEKWNKTIEIQFGSHEANSVQQTKDGGYIITGTSTFSFGVPNRMALLMKCYADGNISWFKLGFGSEGFEFSNSVQQTNDSGYITAGSTNSSGAGKDDVWLIKTDNNGNKLWDKTFGGSNTDQASSVRQTRDGGYIIAGYTCSYGAGNKDAWLIKTDANGNKLWDRTFGGSNDDAANSVQQTTDGGYIITGYTGYSESYAGTADAWLIKTDANGNV